MARGNPYVSLRLTPTQIDRLKAEAKRRNITLSELIREAIRLYFLNNEK